MNIELKSKILNDKYTEYVYKTFDIQNQEETQTTIPCNLNQIDKFDWNIGVVYGNSGSGKTTILKSLGKLSDIKFNKDKPLISNFDWLEPSEASRLLSGIGLSSVPSWLRPFRLLSNGEQYRAELAYKIGKAKDGDVILIDEYTSVVDRDVAKAMSYALQKYIRKHNKKIVLSSCHYDIMEWLMPDWTYSPQKGGALERGDCRRRNRPNIKLQVSRVEHDTWNIFKNHHYLTEEVNKAGKFFLFTWNDKPVAMNVVMPMPSGYFENGVRASRLVVLPDFQGLGLGIKCSEFIAGIYRNANYRYFTKTVHPALGLQRENSDDWKATAKNGKLQQQENHNNHLMQSWSIKSRPSFCHEYIGKSISGYDDLLLPTAELRYEKNKLVPIEHSFWTFEK